MTIFPRTFWPPCQGEYPPTILCFLVATPASYHCRSHVVYHVQTREAQLHEDTVSRIVRSPSLPWGEEQSQRAPTCLSLHEASITLMHIEDFKSKCLIFYLLNPKTAETPLRLSS